MPENNPIENFFVRFKHLFENNTTAGLEAIRSLPNTGSSSTGPSDQHAFFTRDKNSPYAHPDVPSYPLPSIDVPGGTWAEHELSCRHFVKNSPYSPLILDTQMNSACPRPRDSNFDPPRAFGTAYPRWSCAFEDFLRASSGQDLPRPGYVHGCLLEPNHHYDFPWYSWPLWESSVLQEARADGNYWLQHPARHRLTEAYFPVDDPATGYRSPGTVAEWVSFNKAKKDMIYEQMHEHKKPVAAGSETQLDMNESVLKQQKHISDNDRDSIATFFGQLFRYSMAMNGMVEAEVDRLGKEMTASSSHEIEADKRDKETHSTPSSSSRFWNWNWGWDSASGTYKNSPSSRSVQEWVDENNTKTSTETTKDASGYTVTTTTQIFLDDAGFEHTKKRVRVADGEGNVVAEYMTRRMGYQNAIQQSARSGSSWDAFMEKKAYGFHHDELQENGDGRGEIVKKLSKKEGLEDNKKVKKWGWFW